MAWCYCAEELPAYAASVRARFPDAPEHLKPYSDTLHVQYLMKKFRFGEVRLVGAVMDVRTHRIIYPSEPANRQPRHQVEIAYAMGVPAVRLIDAAWALWDAVLWKEVMGQPASPEFRRMYERMSQVDDDEWRVAEEGEVVLARPGSPKDASSSKKGVVREKATGRSKSPSTRAGLSRRKAKSSGDVDESRGANPATSDSGSKCRPERPLRSVLRVEREDISTRAGPRSEPLMLDGPGLLTFIQPLLKPRRCSRTCQSVRMMIRKTSRKGVVQARSARGHLEAARPL
jgi:hypothetical protein